ncbi:N-6 DNA methylase [Streptomyces sp. NPDC056749]|uniref:N-6 DNA methylase n=1 Tax=Streptomyces sp. NPDC056749 TaxID=3345936 RepID=UPI003692F62F
MAGNEALLQPAKQTLALLGYGADLVEEKYPIWTPQGNVAADLAAFARRDPKDMSTAAIVVQAAPESGYLRAQQEAADLALILAAPFTAVALPNGLNISSVNTDGESHTLAEVSYSDPASATRIAHRIDPRSILEAKTGSRHPGLFPVDISILEKARKNSGERLTPRVEAALTAAFDVLGYKHRKTSSLTVERYHQRAARLVVGALTALVLRDKSGLSKTSPGSLIDTILQQHPKEFSWAQKLKTQEFDALTGIIAGLGGDIDFRGLDPAILSEVYEAALVSDAQRRNLGTHYTPPTLARRILAETPVETIPPRERTVVDPTCGSGGLLLAAHDRLRGLQPSDLDLQESHRELTAHLHGFDTDPFAVEIARLSLFLHAVPAGNGWDVKNEDALDVSLAENEKPSIIVANPPWKNTNVVGGRRREMADDFLLWMLENIRPGGLLSIVLPVGWLDSRSSREVRDQVKSACDIFEVWRLPKGSFNSANAAPTVLFARRSEKSNSQGSLLFRRVLNRTALERFYKSGHFSESHLTSAQNIPEGAGPLLTGPLTDWANSYPPLATVGDFAQIISGPQPLPQVANRSDGSENCAYLKFARDLNSFAEPPQDKLIRLRFPEDFQTARGSAGLGKRKILTPAASGPDTPWRIKPSVDLDGILVRNSVHMVLPHEDDDEMLYGLLAFLGSGFASAWVDERALERNISTTDARTIPAPSPDVIRGRLAEIGQELHDSADSLHSKYGLLQELEQTVWEVMNVPEALRLKLQGRLSAAPAPDKEWRYQWRADSDISAEGGRLRVRYGSVLATSENAVLLDVPGVTSSEGEWVEPPSGMPGSLCRPGETFDVRIRDNAPLASGKYTHQNASWMSSEDMFTRVQAADIRHEA